MLLLLLLLLLLSLLPPVDVVVAAAFATRFCHVQRHSGPLTMVVMLVMMVGGGEGLVMRMVIYQVVIRGLDRDASASAHYRLVEVEDIREYRKQEAQAGR